MTTVPTRRHDGSVITTTTMLRDGENENENVIDENTDNDYMYEKNENKKNATIISKKDVIFYFLCGILADAFPGFFFSTTIISALQIPNGSPAIMSLSGNIGGMIGSVMATFVLVKLSPKVRVIINAILQLLGILLAWLLDYPGNVIAGVSILTIGFQGMLTTIMPLSNYAGEMATRSYQVGFSAAPILGIVLVEIGVGVDFQPAGFFSMALALPILTVISFFCLDHSVWTKAIEMNSNDPDHDIQSQEQIVDQQSSDDDDNQEKEQKQQWSQSQHEQERESSVSFFVEEFDEAETLTLQDYKIGIKEIVFRYIPIYLVNFGLLRFWNDVIYQPSFVSSSATYHGLDGEQSILASDNVLVVAHVGVFLIGLTIFTCLGTIIPQNLSPYWLWIPNLCTTILLTITLAGVAYGAFPPLSIGAVYAITTLMNMCMFCVYLYTPLFVRNDTSLTKKYLEFVLILISNTTYLLVSILDLVWWSDVILQKCISNYEDVYNISNSNNNATSCTFFK